MPVLEAPEAKLDLHSTHVKAAAEARGIPTVTKIVQSGGKRNTWLTFHIAGQEFFYARGMLLAQGSDEWDRIGLNVNHEASLLIADKFKCKQHLSSKGFSVPKGQFFRRRKLEEAYTSFTDFSGPICVKPNHGSEGRCVFPNITDETWFKTAIDRVAARFPNILIEESVIGEHFRFFYVEPEVVGIRYGRPCSVVGDGHSSLLQLAQAKNTERAERNLPTHPQFPISDAIHEYLERHGRTLEDIPPAGERVFLSGVSNATAGADSYLFWDEVHPSYREIVAKACKEIPGLLYSGVDLVIEDYRVPATDDNYWLLEFNASPALLPFYYPWQGKKVDVAARMLDLLERHYTTT